ncbi:hypothetical protein [Paenibacillus sp. 1011MAR3C5]|nr:hypothetical protein [Paenibacillus sp. 1011MAR3C5]
MSLMPYKSDKSQLAFAEPLSKRNPDRQPMQIGSYTTSTVI